MGGLGELFERDRFLRAYLLAAEAGDARVIIYFRETIPLFQRQRRHRTLVDAGAAAGA